MNILQRIKELWEKLPKFIRDGLFFLAVFFALGPIFNIIVDAPGAANAPVSSVPFDLIPVSIFFLIVILAMLAVIPLLMMMFFLRKQDPTDIVSEGYEQLMDGAKKDKQPESPFQNNWWIFVFLLPAFVIGFAGLFGSYFKREDVAFAPIQAPAPAPELLSEPTILVMILAFGVPLLATGFSWLVKRFSPAAHLRVAYSLRLPLSVSEVWKARKQIERLPEVSPAFSSAEKVEGSELPQVRLSMLDEAKGWGMPEGGVLTVLEQQEDRLLVLEFVSENGDIELSHFIFSPINDHECLIEGTHIAQMSSAFLKVIVWVLGAKHMGKGAATVEAEYFSRLTGVKAELLDIRSTVSKKSPEGK